MSTGLGLLAFNFRSVSSSSWRIVACASSPAILAANDRPASPGRLQAVRSPMLYAATASRLIEEQKQGPRQALRGTARSRCSSCRYLHQFALCLVSKLALLSYGLIGVVPCCSAALSLTGCMSFALVGCMELKKSLCIRQQVLKGLRLLAAAPRTAPRLAAAPAAAWHAAAASGASSSARAGVATTAGPGTARVHTAAAAAASAAEPATSLVAGHRQGPSESLPLSGLVLGIESSCDDTGVAVVTPSGRILGESLATQADIHAAWGGVVPKLAQEAHEAAIDGCVDAALAAAGVTPDQLSAVAVTIGPGLSLCLRVRG